MIGIVQSIRHRWAEMIYRKEKKWEIRKTEPVRPDFLQQDTRLVYIYEPEEKAITGVYVLGDVYRTDGPEIAAQFPIGLDEDEVRAYGPGRDGVYRLWRADAAQRYEEALPLQAFGLKRAPQSWCYVGKL